MDYDIIDLSDCLVQICDYIKERSNPEDIWIEFIGVHHGHTISSCVVVLEVKEMIGCVFD